LALWAVAPVLAPTLGLGEDWLPAASTISLVAAWLLATYPGVVARVPVTQTVLRRRGWWSIAGVAVLEAGFDLVALATDLGVVGLVPVTQTVWRRWGWWSIAGGGVLAAVFDLVSLATDLEVVGHLNVLVVWVTMHQCGYAWSDRRTPWSLTRGLLVCG